MQVKRQNMKILLTLAYDGRNFAGFQVQGDRRTVQKTVQDALEALYRTRPGVVGCSRTDAGVHARDYKLTYVVEGNMPTIPTEKLPCAVNRFLPYDIAVSRAEVVPDDFHVRHDVYEKEYEYRVYCGKSRDPFSHGRAYHVGRRYDAERLGNAAQAFLGTHDFRAFMASGSDIGDTVRTVRSVSVEEEGDFLLFRIAADGFLYNMVRIYVGTLLAVGDGRIDAEALPEIIASGDRKKAGPTVPPDGLYLNRVTFSAHPHQTDIAPRLAAESAQHSTIVNK